MKKEEAIKKIGELEKDVADWSASDKNRRDTLTKIILGLVPRDNIYPSREPQCLSWLEIAAEIGKLLQMKTQLDQTEYIRNLEAENWKLKNPPPTTN